MEHEADLRDKRDSIGKAVVNLRVSLDTLLSRIKVGLEKSYLNLYRKGLGALEHSAKKCIQRSR